LNINLRSNNISENGIKSLTLSFTQLLYLKSLFLNLRSNSFDEKGAIFLLESLLKVLPKFNNLIINMESNNIIRTKNLDEVKNNFRKKKYSIQI